MMLLRSLLLGTIALSSSAYAADLPSHMPAPQPPMMLAYNWSGLYVGGYVGGSFGTVKMLDVSFPDFINGNRLDPTSITAGGLAGYNVQIGSIVIGGEGDMGYDGRHSSQDYFNSGGDRRHEEFSGSYLGRLRGRVGFAFNNLLLYGAGGVSFADGKLKFSNPFNDFTQSTTKRYTGFNVGSGVEYAFTNNWVGRVEYIYDDLGKQMFLKTPTPPGDFDGRKASLRENTVRAAIAYKF